MVLISPTLFGLLGALAVNALPRPAAAPQASQSLDPTKPWSYICKPDGTGYEDQLGNAVPCNGGTVCKDGVIGNPCVWPDIGNPVSLGAVASPSSGSVAGASSAAASNVAAHSASSSAGGAAQSTAANGGALSSIASNGGGQPTSSVVGASQAASSVAGATSPPASLAANQSLSSAATGASLPAASSVASGAASLPVSGGAISASTGPAAGSSLASVPYGGSSSVAGFNPTAAPTAGPSGAPGASGGAGQMMTKTAGSGPVVYEAPDTSSVDSETPSEGGTRLVAYYDNYVNFDGVSTSQLKGVTHLIMSFIDAQTMLAGENKWLHSDLGNFGPEITANLRRQKPGMKILAALGGWNNDKEIKYAADGGTIDAFATAAAGFVEQHQLDGLDLDWEFPKENQTQGFIDMCKALKDKMGQDKLLTVALGSKEEDGKAFTSEVFSALDSVVDMWNLMTYDYVNRYDTKTGHQSGGGVVKKTVEFYQGQGLTDLKKVNIGFLMDAKYFSLTEPCLATPPIGCTMGGKEYFETISTEPETAGQSIDNGLSGWLRYNPYVDPSIGGKGSEMAAKMRASFESAPKDNSTAFPEELTHAWYDDGSKVFWTWTTAEDNTAICEEWKSKVGGMMIWSLNQDAEGVNGGPHLDAVASCVAGG
ncbi:hypothetical protein IAT40_000635 [Kwoniella sp. CBS 6097]